MTIQLQVLTVHAFTCLLYMLQPDERKALINMLSRSEAAKIQQVED